MRGSHRIFAHDIKAGIVIVPGKAGDDIFQGTLGNLYLFEPIINPIVGMPILARTKGGATPLRPLTLNLQRCPLASIWKQAQLEDR